MTAQPQDPTVMSGPECFAEALRLLTDAAFDLASGHAEFLRAEHDTKVARAQVYATLAVAASNVAPRALGPQEAWGGQHLELLSPERDAWEAVTGTGTIKETR